MHSETSPMEPFVRAPMYSDHCMVMKGNVWPFAYSDKITLNQGVSENHSHCIMKTLVLRPSKFQKKNNAQGDDKHCELHFK